MEVGGGMCWWDWETERMRELFWTNAQYGVNGLVCLLAGLGSLLLFLMRSADREFLWFGVWEIINVLDTLLLPDYSSFHPINMVVWLTTQAILIAGLNVTMPTMILHLRRIHRSRLYWTAITVALLDGSLDLLFTFDWIGFSTFFAIGAFMK